MFEIKKSAWHFKMVKLFHESFIWESRRNLQLCPYARRVMFDLFFLAPLLVLGILFIVSCLVFVFAIPILIHFYGFSDLGLSIISMAGYIFVGWMMLDYSVKHGYKHDIALYKPKPKPIEYVPPKQPNIVSIYLTALHDKICPTLKVVDE